MQTRDGFAEERHSAGRQAIFSERLDPAVPFRIERKLEASLAMELARSSRQARGDCVAVSLFRDKATGGRKDTPQRKRR